MVRVHQEKAFSVSLVLVVLLFLISNSWGQAIWQFAWWQIKYFGITNSPEAAPDADPCGKGMSNTNQFLVGLDPTNCASIFRILAVAPPTNGVSAAESGLGIGQQQAGPSLDLVVTYYTSGGNAWEPPPPRTNVLEYSTTTPADDQFISTGVTNVLVEPGDVVTNMVDIGGATNGPVRFYRVRFLL